MCDISYWSIFMVVTIKEQSFRHKLKMQEDGVSEMTNGNMYLAS